MKENIISTVLLTISTLCFSSCKPAIELPSEYAHMSFKAECLGKDQSGNQILRIWGRGKNRSEAIAQALRNAVSTVLFDGVQGSGECDKRPILSVPNSREVFEGYFINFFADNGPYTEYVNIDEKRTSRIMAKNTTTELWSITVSVNRPKLRIKLISDGIIK